MNALKATRGASLTLTVFWCVVFLPYSFFALMSGMLSDGLYSGSPAYETALVYAFIVVAYLNILVIPAGIIAARALRSKGRPGASVLVQLVPAALILILCALSLLDARLA